MNHTSRLLAFVICTAGCAPTFRFPSDWDASPDAARSDASRADAQDARGDVADAPRSDRAEVLAVDVPGADVVVIHADGAADVVWITDRPQVDTSADAGTSVTDVALAEDTGADAPLVDAGGPAVDAPVVDVAVPCGALQDRCGGVCTPILLDPMNCGGCGRACPGAANATPVCNGGRCEVACREGYADCGRGTGCQDTRTDHGNCGGCGVVCGLTEQCEGGRCVGCPSGQAVCAGSCVNRTTDSQNCGVCGVACTGGRACVSAECAYVPCGAGGSHVMCGDRCADLMTDAANCLVCGNVCGAGMACRGGTCSPR